MSTLSKALFLFGLPTLVLTTSGLTAAADPQPTLAGLLKEYQALGLPLPPEKARLVQFEAGGGGIVNGVVQPPEYWLAFEVKPGTKEEPPVLLQGALEYQPSWVSTVRGVEPDLPAVKGVKIGADEGLVLAIQCHARGWDCAGPPPA